MHPQNGKELGCATILVKQILRPTQNFSLPYREARRISRKSVPLNCGHSSLPTLCGKAKGKTNFLRLWLLLKGWVQGHSGRASAGHGPWETCHFTYMHKHEKKKKREDKQGYMWRKKKNTLQSHQGRLNFSMHPSLIRPTGSVLPFSLCLH